MKNHPEGSSQPSLEELHKVELEAITRNLALKIEDHIIETLEEQAAEATTRPINSIEGNAIIAGALGAVAAAMVYTQTDGESPKVEDRFKTTFKQTFESSFTKIYSNLEQSSGPGQRPDRGSSKPRRDFE